MPVRVLEVQKKKINYHHFTIYECNMFHSGSFARSSYEVRCSWTLAHNIRDFSCPHLYYSIGPVHEVFLDAQPNNVAGHFSFASGG